jgi:hypothetical protein
VLAELKELVAYRARYLGGPDAAPLMALGLSSRKNLCVHPKVGGGCGTEGGGYVHGGLVVVMWLCGW